MLVGKTQQLKATTGPKNYVGHSGYGTVTWSTSSANIATVSNSGLVIFKSTGYVAITAKYSDGKHKVVYDTVYYNAKPALSDLKVDRKINNTTVSDNCDYIFVDFERSWNVKSTNGWEAIVKGIPAIEITNKDNGKLTYKAIKPGKTSILIRERFTNVIYECTVIVIEPVKKIEITNKNSSFEVYDLFTFEVKNSPYTPWFLNKGYGSVKWTISDSNVAQITAGATGKKCTILFKKNRKSNHKRYI